MGGILKTEEAEPHLRGLGALGMQEGGWVSDSLEHVQLLTHFHVNSGCRTP